MNDDSLIEAMNAAFLNAFNGSSMNDAMRAALAVVREAWGKDAERWQPIETAPRDGTHILAYRAPVGIRFTNMTNPPTVVHWFDDPDEPGFYTSVNEIAPEHPFQATHWAPLINPPAIDAARAQEKQS